MEYTVETLTTEVLNTNKSLTLQDWKDKSDYRDITKRSQKDFDDLLPMYVKKINGIREQLRGDWAVTIIPFNGEKIKTPQELGDELTEQLTFFINKEDRLKDKFATCIKEVEMREEGQVIRTDLHDQANYYIDYDNGNDGSDGLSTGNAWKTITKYTTTTVRTAGDIAYLRAGITWDQGTEAVDIVCDEDGNDDNYIKIVGCDSVTNDPWSDSSDVLPIVDFEDASYQMMMNGDDYWYIERLDFRRSTDGSGLVYLINNANCYLKSCVFRDLTTTSDDGLYCNQSEGTVDSCTFYNCVGVGVRLYAAKLHIKACTFNGGGDTTDYGIYASGSWAEVEDTTFGDTTTFDTADVRARYGSIVYCRNCTFGTTTSVATGGMIFAEDGDGIFEQSWMQSSAGFIQRETTVVRGGGANSSARMSASSPCGPNNPLTLSSNLLKGDFQIFLSAGQHTVTIYATRGATDWTTEPGNSGQEETFYIQASYLSNGASAARSLSTKSAQDISDDANWTAFTTTFTMAREGWAYITVYLQAFENPGTYIYVDLKRGLS